MIGLVRALTRGAFLISLSVLPSPLCSQRPGRRVLLQEVLDLPLVRLKLSVSLRSRFGPELVIVSVVNSLKTYGLLLLLTPILATLPPRFLTKFRPGLLQYRMAITDLGRKTAVAHLKRLLQSLLLLEPLLHALLPLYILLVKSVGIDFLDLLHRLRGPAL